LVLFAPVLILLSFVEGGREAGLIAGFLAVAALGGALFGAAFIFEGVRSVRGTAPDTLRNGVASIFLGLLNLPLLILSLSRSHGGGLVNQVIEAGIGSLAVVVLLAAGVLALVGRRKYQRWRQAQSH
jgi:hypothetical protein